MDGFRHRYQRAVLSKEVSREVPYWTKAAAEQPPFSWCFIHIKLTEEEAQAWKDMPVINNRELGYLFEPDVEGRRLKIAPHGVGYTHYMAPGKSYPRSKSKYPSDGIPTEAKEQVRELLRDALPTLAERPFEYERLCWDAE